MEGAVDADAASTTAPAFLHSLNGHVQQAYPFVPVDSGRSSEPVNTVVNWEGDVHTHTHVEVQGTIDHALQFRFSVFLLGRH